MVIKTLDPEPDSHEMLDLDSVNPVPQYWYSSFSAEDLSGKPHRCSSAKSQNSQNTSNAVVYQQSVENSVSFFVT
jgi:hypothetical protein